MIERWEEKGLTVIECMVVNVPACHEGLLQGFLSRYTLTVTSLSTRGASIDYLLTVGDWLGNNWASFGIRSTAALASIFRHSSDTPYSLSMADHKLKRKFSRSHSLSPKPRPSIHQSGDNATITIQGSYNDVGRDQINTNITNLGGASSVILSKQNSTITIGHDLVCLLWLSISCDVNSLIFVPIF